MVDLKLYHYYIVSGGGYLKHDGEIVRYLGEDNEIEPWYTFEALRPLGTTHSGGNNTRNIGRHGYCVYIKKPNIIREIPEREVLAWLI
ncbi:MAG: hypothetical protein IMZ52_02805 [Actinobacteria bacterium]|nr:hypothetical protein [Actinomycetota bacterium]